MDPHYLAEFSGIIFSRDYIKLKHVLRNICCQDK